MIVPAELILWLTCGDLLLHCVYYMLLRAGGGAQVRIGMAIMVCFDLADIFLPLAKALRYLRLEPLDDIAFAVFAVVWIPTRCSPFDSSLSS